MQGNADGRRDQEKLIKKTRTKSPRFKAQSADKHNKGKKPEILKVVTVVRLPTLSPD